MNLNTAKQIAGDILDAAVRKDPRNPSDYMVLASTDGNAVNTAAVQAIAEARSVSAFVDGNVRFQ